MYCSSCGVAVTQSLSYCQHCGAKLNGAPGDGVIEPSETPTESLIWAIVTVFIVGFGCIIGLMAIMKEVLNVNVGLILIVALLGFLLMLAVESVFIWLLWNRNRGAQAGDNTAREQERATKALQAAPARVLHEGGMNVTEDTTRKFEPVYRARKAD